MTDVLSRHKGKPWTHLTSVPIAENNYLECKKLGEGESCFRRGKKIELEHINAVQYHNT